MSDDIYGTHTVLLLHMEGANNSTTFIDSSGLPKTITRYGDTKISTTQSKWGSGSGYFDGNGDYLSLNNVNTLQLHDGDYTVELWVYFLSVPVGCALITNRFISASDTFPFALAFGDTLGSIGGSKLYFGYYNHGWFGALSAFTPTINTWYHLAVTRSGNTVRVFVDGAKNIELSVNTLPPPTGDFLIGRRWDNSGGVYVASHLQDLRITKDIARYTANFTPPAARLPDPDPATGLIIPSGYRRDIYDGGAYRITGNVDELGVAGSYRVRLFDRQSARCIRETWSAADGSYAFNHIAYRDQGYFAVAFDHGDNPLNAAIADLITPELMP